MFRLHGLLVTSRPLVYTQPSRYSKSIAPYTPIGERAQAESACRLMLVGTLRAWPRGVSSVFAREAFGDYTFASLRASPAPVGRRHSFRKLVPRARFQLAYFVENFSPSCRCQGLHFGQSH